MNIKLKLLPILACAAAPFAVAAQTPVSFDLGKAIRGLYTHTDTVDGLTMTITTTNDWGGNPGFEVLNGGLYIVTENNFTMTLNFNKSVRFDGYTISSVFQVNNDESLAISVGGDLKTTETNRSPGTYDFNTSFTVDANTDITFTSLNPGLFAGTNIKWSTLRVTVVPEPATYALIIGGLALGGVILRRRFRR